MSWGEIYNTSWWGVALDTARTVKARPDFFGSQLNLLTSEQPNLVTNGTFDTDSDWVKGGGATISGGKANIIGDGSAFGYVEQVGTFVSGKKYKVTLDAIINSGGGLVVKYGFPYAANIGDITTSGSYTFYYTAATSGSIIIGRSTGGVAYNSSIDNVSVQVARAELDQIEAKKCLADWIHTTALKDLNN